jgi:transposase
MPIVTISIALRAKSPAKQGSRHKTLTEMIAPHRGNRSKPPTQDPRRLSRYMRRWLVERFFAWIQWQRRILVWWEYHAHNFLGFVQLACLVILFKRF